MYELFIRFRNGKEMKSKMTEKELRVFLSKKSKTPVAWAKVTTPSKVTKDVTKYIV